MFSESGEKIRPVVVLERWSIGQASRESRGWFVCASIDGFVVENRSEWGRACMVKSHPSLGGKTQQHEAMMQCC